MRETIDFDVRITSIADPDDTSDADIQAMEQWLRRLDSWRNAIWVVKSDRQIVRELFPNLLCCLKRGTPLREIFYEALFELEGMQRVTLTTFRRTIAAERKQHPRLSPTVQTDSGRTS